MYLALWLFHKSIMATLPRTPRSLNAQRVLDEDEYTEALSHIIARDFYPSLVAHLDTSPLRSQNTTTMAGTAAAADTPFGHGPSDTPRGENETDDVSEDGPPSRKRARFDLELSLDSFQARYTSEDNSSFTQILDEENRKRKERWAWAWEAQKRVEAQRAKALETRERMMIMGAPAPGVREKILIEAPRPIGLLTDKETEDEEDSERQKQLVAIIQKEEEQVDVLAPKKDTREAGVDGWKFKVRTLKAFALKTETKFFCCF
jgi:protein DGCR14